MNKVEQIKAYREAEGYNYSLLKSVIEEKHKPFEGNVSSELGSLLDNRLTMSEEEFDSLYVVYDEERYKGKLADIMEKFFKRYSYYQPITKPYEHYRDKLVDAAKEAEFGGKDKKLDKIAEALDKIQGLWDLLILKQTREVISKSELEYADKIIIKLKTEMPGKAIFDKPHEFQVPVFGTTIVRGQEVPIKGLIDILLVSDEGIAVVDLKRTEFSLNNWSENVLKMKYHLQASMYTNIVQQMYPNKPVSFFWLAVNGFDIRLFQAHEADLRIGKEGGRSIYSMTYDCTDEKLVKEVYHMGYIDGIAKLLDIRALGLDHYNLEKHNNQGVYPAKSIFE